MTCRDGREICQDMSPRDRKHTSWIWEYLIFKNRI
jgi:hypothetical protein